MSATVYFADVKTRSHADSKLVKIGRLCDAVGLEKFIKPKSLVAVKLHFGEYGCDTYLNPALIRPVIDKIKALGGKPFLTDTNTMYSGSRRNAVDHLHTAYAHGFVPSVVDAPVIIADGIRGGNFTTVPIKLKHFDEAYIGQEIFAADCMVVLSHFKGHEMAGFGGAIKNLAMGCGSVAGKRAQHSNPVTVNEKTCIGCGNCAKACPQDAITIAASAAGEKAQVNRKKCIGCYGCVTVCAPKAIGPNSDTELELFVERIAEYAYAAVQGKQDKIAFINFVTNVTPDCDCCSWSDAPLVPDIGLAASTDPVALDTACFDLVKNAISLFEAPGLGLGEKGMNIDKFSARHKRTFGLTQLSYGEAIGLGSKNYELVQV